MMHHSILIENIIRDVIQKQFVIIVIFPETKKRSWVKANEPFHQYIWIPNRFRRDFQRVLNRFREGFESSQRHRIGL
jgi:hypothetical protein